MISHIKWKGDNIAAVVAAKCRRRHPRLWLSEIVEYAIHHNWTIAISVVVILMVSLLTSVALVD